MNFPNRKIERNEFLKRHNPKKLPLTFNCPFFFAISIRFGIVSGGDGDWWRWCLDKWFYRFNKIERTKNNKHTHRDTAKTCQRNSQSKFKPNEKLRRFVNLQIGIPNACVNEDILNSLNNCRLVSWMLKIHIIYFQCENGFCCRPRRLCSSAPN